MNTRPEAFKSNTILFTIEMVKKSLSDFLIDEIFELDEKYEKEITLTTELNTKEEIKRLKELLDKEIKHRDGGLYESCMEELREIKDDLKWSNTADGRLILKLEDWVIGTRNRISGESWDSVFIGRSIIDPKQLNIGGVVRNENERNEIKAKIALWAPPVPPIYLLESDY